jgi:hypothetical protein
VWYWVLGDGGKEYGGRRTEKEGRSRESVGRRVMGAICEGLEMCEGVSDPIVDHGNVNFATMSCVCKRGVHKWLVPCL